MTTTAKRTPKPLSIATYLDGGQQELADQRRWIESTRPLTTQAEYDAWQAGFRDAWGKACAFLSLHGHLTMKTV